MNRNQSGAVSIVVSVIIMVVLTLVAVSFAQLMRREERQALDRQLNSQAYYAAESAINDTVYAIQNGQITTNYDTCRHATGPLSEPDLDTTLGISYSCVTVDTTPGTLEYEGLSLETSSMVELRAVDSTNANVQMTSMKISWEDPSGSTNFTALTNPANLQSQTAWGTKPGMVRVEIVPLPNTSSGALDRAQLIAARKVFFLYPSTGASSTYSFAATPTGEILGGACNAANTPRDCNVTLDTLPIADATGTYLVRLRSVYKQVDVTVSGLAGASNVNFSGSQAAIDATGKANDVLRRIRANVSFNNSSLLPEYVIQAFSGICKDLEVVSNAQVVYGCYP